MTKDGDAFDWQLPDTTVERLEDRSPTEGGGFLRLRRFQLRSTYEDGTSSEPFLYDCVERRALDAVVLVLHTADGRVCVRSSLRPPIVFRHEQNVPMFEHCAPLLWELPAGLIEPDERGDEGLRACAVRETLEETGLSIEPDTLCPLGPSVYLSPGVIAERLYYFRAEVDDRTRGVPTEDGTPVEARAEVRFVALPEALAACDAGHIGDCKSEVGIRRLAAFWSSRP